jgi:hypothetical protein
MRVHGIVLACCTLLATAPALAIPIAVQPNIQVSKQHESLFHGEVIVGADPVNPQHLIACSGVWPPESDRHPVVMAYMTIDGGLTWNQVDKSFSKADGLDPVCGFGFHNIVYLGSYGSADVYWWQHSEQPIPRGGIDPEHDYLAYSRDGGRTWSKPHALKAGDRPMLAVDTTTSRFRGRVYYEALTNDHGNPIHSCICLVYSADNGKTIAPRVTIFHNPPGLEPKKSLFSGGITVLSNGTLVALSYQWPSFANPAIVAFTSTNGGISFSRAHLVTKRTVDANIAITSGFSPIPLAASDTTSGPFRNRVYAVWDDFRFGQGNILLAHSDDAGKTWSAPIVVDDAPPAASGGGPFASNPAIAVNSKGVVGVTWYDERGIAGNVGAVVRFAASNDGGESFSSSVPIASVPSLVDVDVNRQPLGSPNANAGNTVMIGTLPRYHVFGGDTSGLAADAAGAFHPVWIDDRSGVAQVWTSKVTVRAVAIRHGDRSLASLDDVTKDIVLRFTNASYDRTTHVTSADVAVVNASSHTIRGPIRIRVTRLAPVRGEATILGADNGEPAAGAVWVFPVAAQSNVLRRGDRTAFRSLQFRVDRLQPYPLDNGRFYVPYAEFQFRAYASP